MSAATLLPGTAPDPLDDPLINAVPPVPDRTELLAILAEAYGLKGSLVPLSGERDCNFRLDCTDGQRLLVKLAQPAEDADITDFQSQALLHLETADPGLAVPRMVRTRTGALGLTCRSDGDRLSRLRVLTFLPGEPMRRIGNASHCRAFGTFMARLDRGLQGFRHPAEGRRLLWDIRETGAFDRLLALVEDRATLELTRLALEDFKTIAAPVLARLPLQLIHNDANPHNVLVHADAPNTMMGVIDFGDILRAPRVQEVATSCAYLIAEGPAPLAGAAAFLAGYAADSPLSADEMQALPAAIGMRMTVTILVTNWRARQQPENATYICRNVPRALAGLHQLARLDQQDALRQLQHHESNPPHV